MFEKYEVVPCLAEDRVDESPSQEVKEIYVIRDKTLDAFLPGRYESLSEAADCCYQLNHDRP